jgi:mannose/cellobiose epimerase-like protein (N-acyl-D-glucosamine 2-epimerase family)
MTVQSFMYADTLGGRVTAADSMYRSFRLLTHAGEEFQVVLTSTTGAEVLRNLGDPYDDCSARLPQWLVPDQFVFAHGLFYPDTGPEVCEAKHLIFCGRGGLICEREGWWVQQIRALADFLLRAEFRGGPADFRQYTPTLGRSGQRIRSPVQEVNSLSRFIYGQATAYLLTGEERFLQAAEQGADYQRTHFRLYDAQRDRVLWYHALDARISPTRPILASAWADDAGAISAFDQIYALAGLVQLYRINADPELLADIERTLRTFDDCFRDASAGGFFSHLDPVTLDPHSPRLGQNQSRKNWNSLGDHAPAYLFNLWLATGDDRFARRLEEIFDQVVQHFPDFAHSPLVLERFHQDWSPDTTWGWQQNRGIVGHNLKIVWSLARMGQLIHKAIYQETADRIAAAMVEVGLDRRRGGWFDALERIRREGETTHRFVWHNRKAWWQQEQGILAFLLLAGSQGRPDYLDLARLSAAFYNAFFLDHDDGGIFFDVTADGQPHLLGTERLKGSQYKGGYHAFELAYLATVYTDLLIHRRPLTLHFWPQSHGLRDRTLRVQPDLMPEGSVAIDAVWLDNRPYRDFDAMALTVSLPQTTGRSRLRVRLRPAVSGPIG